MIYAFKNMFKFLKEVLTNEFCIWLYKLIFILFIGLVGFSFCGIIGNIAFKSLIVNSYKCYQDTTIEK